MNHIKSIFLIIVFCSFSLGCSDDELENFKLIDPDNKNEWTLAWSDEFNYVSRDELLEIWQSRNGHSGNSLVLSSSWQENIEVGDGVVRLVLRRETRLKDIEWTGASMWTKEKFQYGYLECRYKYAAATGTNNSFWLMPDQPNQNKDFEIDINEGHYPNKINTNIHILEPDNSMKVYPSIHTYGSNFSENYHLYGLEWTKHELVFYLDRKEIRREKNISCFSATPLILSLAVLKWAGAVTDAIGGKYMEVDYVRVYKPILSGN